MSNLRDTQQTKHFDSVSEASLASLIRALKSDDKEPLSCAECREHLADIFHLSQAGATLSDDNQAIVAHFANCPDCAAEYLALHEAMVAFEIGDLPELAQSHHFDLSFLTPPAPESQEPAVSLWTKSLTQNLWNFVNEVQIRLDSTRASFGVLPPPLASVIAEGAIFRSESADSQPEVLMLPAPDAEFSIQLAVGPMIAGNAVVVVKLVEMESTRPLVDTLVTLRNGDRQLLVGCMSGQDGCAVFEQLPLGRYFIQIRYNQNTWEVPLVIIGGSPLS